MRKRLEPLQSNKANALGYRDEHGGNGEGLGQRRDSHGEDNTAPAPQGAHPQQHPAPAGLLEAGVRPRHRDAPRAKSVATVPVPGGADGVKAAESSAGPRGLPAAGGGFGHAEEVRVRLTCARCALAAHNPLGRIWTPPAPPRARQQHEPTWKGFGAVRPLAPDPLG